MMSTSDTSKTSFIPKLFLVGAFLGAIGCLSRADYNLPIFLFAYITWSYPKVRLIKFKSFPKLKKVEIIVLFLFSFFVDVIWFFYISRSIWKSEEYQKLAPWETGLHTTVNWVTFLNFILKVKF